MALTLGALIAAGQAGEAYQLLARQLDDERMTAEAPEAAFYADLLRYLRCAAPFGARISQDVWGEARAHLAVERLRLQRHQKERLKTGPDAWLAEGRLDWSLPSKSSGGAVIVWPAEDERWSDEETQVAPPAVGCGPLIGKPDLGAEAEAARKQRLATKDPALRMPLLLDEAVLRARLAEWAEVWVLVRQIDAGGLQPDEQAQAALLGALAAEHEGGDALSRWEQTLALPLDPDERKFVDVHRQKLLMAQQKWAEAKKLLDQYSNLGGALGRYLRYRSAVARFQMGDEAALLASARALLGKRSVAEIDGDPISRATEELVYLQLARHPFSPEQIEVVESLGHPRELYARMDRMGKVALDRGRPQLALEIFRWLSVEHKLAYLKPYYLSRLAAAAAAAGDGVTFQASFQTLVTPPKKRSIEWDRQLLFCTRDAVTFLIARKDWTQLRILISALQSYLRAAPGPYAELTQLYRLASTQLPAGPRAYAEKIGAERAPLWLGSVTLDRPREVVEEPALPLPDLDGPVTLLCLPDGKGGCPRWFGPEVRRAK